MTNGNMYGWYPREYYGDLSPEAMALTAELEARRDALNRAEEFIAKHAGTADPTLKTACELIHLMLADPDVTRRHAAHDLYWALNRLVKKYSPKGIEMAKAVMRKAIPGREPGT